MKDYVIGVKLKGQNVVLKEVNAIKKAGEKLAKNKINVKIGAKVGAVATAASTAAASKAATPNFDTKKYVAQAKEAGGKARDVLGSAMTSGVSGIASMLPGIGSLFSASQSAVGSAAQEYVAGITASKNIQLITANFERAFGNAMDGAFKNSMFANRQNKAVYANLAEQGVKVSTLADRGNVDLIDKLARAQGVGSLEELFQRMQSGQLKEGAGLGKGEIEFLKSASQMLNNRYSSEIGMQTILQTLKGRKSEIEKVAGADYMAGTWQKDPKTGKMYRAGGLSNAVRAEGDIRETEENYQVRAARELGRKGYDAMQDVRLADLKIRAKTLGAVVKIEKFKADTTGRVVNLADNVEKEGLVEGYKKTVKDYINEKAKEQAGVPDGGGGEEIGGSGSGGGAPLSRSNSDLTRAGEALAATLNKINSQLMAVQYQMRTRGA